MKDLENTDDLDLFNTNAMEDLRNWLTTKTLCGHSHKSSFLYYDKQLWLPLKRTIESINKRANKSIEELELLSCCYTGELFRIQNYNENKRAHIFPLGRYQSWCTEDGLDVLSKTGGCVLLIRGHASPEDCAIKTMELMFYLKPEISGLLFSGKHELSRYIKEHEVVMPIKKPNIDSVYIVESKHLAEWRSFAEPLKQEKWFRNNW